MYLEKELKDMARAAWLVCNGEECYSREWYSQSLVSNIESIVRHNSFTLEEEDIRQQLFLLALQNSNRYTKKPYSLTKRSYVLGNTIRDLRDWLRKELATPDYSGCFELFSSLEEPVEDLLWMCTPWEKYLLSLRYNHDMTQKEIGKITRKPREYVNKKLGEILDMVRSYYAT